MRTSTVLTFGGFAAAVAAYHFLVRPRLLRWGATDEEVERDMVGDELVSQPNYVSTRAVTVAAIPDEIFPLILEGRRESLPVKLIDAPRSLVVEPVPAQCSWAFTLYPHADGTTRLVMRVRARLTFRPVDFVLDPAEFMLRRGMLLDIKRRAEEPKTRPELVTTRTEMIAAG